MSPLPTKLDDKGSFGAISSGGGMKFDLVAYKTEQNKVDKPTYTDCYDTKLKAIVLSRYGQQS